jgi:predicted dinucleotide-utilizing enzyme
MSRGLALPTLEQTMKALLTILAALFISPAFADDSAAAEGANHRYLIERTFPAGALDGLDAATKEKVNANNATVGVRWLHSYANAERTKTFCVYEGPSEDAVRQAAILNGLPVDSVVEVPVDLMP